MTTRSGTRLDRRRPSVRFTNGVVTPHASFLALRFAPREALENLRKLKAKFPIYGDYGFMDSVNVSKGVVSDRVLALDQGMIMAAIANALADDAMRQAFVDGPFERILRPLIAPEEFTAGVDLPGHERVDSSRMFCRRNPGSCWISRRSLPIIPRDPPSRGRITPHSSARAILMVVGRHTRTLSLRILLIVSTIQGITPDSRGPRVTARDRVVGPFLVGQHHSFDDDHSPGETCQAVRESGPWQAHRQELAVPDRNNPELAGRLGLRPRPLRDPQGFEPHASARLPLTYR